MGRGQLGKNPHPVPDQPPGPCSNTIGGPSPPSSTGVDTPARSSSPVTGIWPAADPEPSRARSPALRLCVLAVFVIRRRTKAPRSFASGKSCRSLPVDVRTRDPIVDQARRVRRRRRWPLPATDVEFDEDVADVTGHCLVADDQLFGDGPVGLARFATSARISASRAVNHRVGSSSPARTSCSTRSIRRRRGLRTHGAPLSSSKSAPSWSPSLATPYRAASGAGCVVGCVELPPDVPGRTATRPPATGVTIGKEHAPSVCAATARTRGTSSVRRHTRDSSSTISRAAGRSFAARRISAYAASTRRVTRLRAGRRRRCGWRRARRRRDVPRASVGQSPLRVPAVLAGTSVGGLCFGELTAQAMELGSAGQRSADGRLTHQRLTRRAASSIASPQSPLICMISDRCTRHCPR